MLKGWRRANRARRIGRGRRLFDRLLLRLRAMTFPVVSSLFSGRRGRADREDIPKAKVYTTGV